MKKNMAEDTFDNYQNIISKLKSDKEAIGKRALENPELFLKEMGFDNKNLNLEELKKFAENLTKNAGSLESLFNNPNFNNLSGYQNSIKNKAELTDLEKDKLKELGTIAFKKDLKEKQKSCFINKECDDIIKAHSIQENGELSKIATKIKGKEQVLHFIQNTQTAQKELTEIDITSASTFYGFCHKHDQTFEPLDKKTCQTDSERNFLYSFRSFAHSYHNIKSYQNYFVNFIGDTVSSINPLIETFKNISSGLGLNLTAELVKTELPKINKEQIENLELVRFEKYRWFLIDYLTSKSYSQLDFLTYEINHSCPIVCASWMVMHINFGNGFMIIHDENKPYYGFPIMLSLLPVDNQKSILVLARFKIDSGSELIFNQLNNLKSQTEVFEKEISKLIIENVENFYLSPNFWTNLSEDEREIITKAANIEKKQFPEGRTTFDVINFFDKKYSLNNTAAN